MRRIILLTFALAVPSATHAQHDASPQAVGNPLTGSPVRGAPFTAEATTTVHLTLRDGTRVDRTSNARYFRERGGRVRVEQPTTSMDWPNLADGKHVRIRIDTDRHDGGVYVLDPVARSVREGVTGLESLAVGGGNTFALPLGGPQFLVFARPGSGLAYSDTRATVAMREQWLGSRQIAGVDTIGRRVTVTITPPPGHDGSNRHIEVVDERWESPELKIVIYARMVDPRAGIVEYLLSNIRRAEPDPGLFVVPEDYTPALSPITERISLVFADALTRRSNLKLAVDRLRR